jgi:hypothetical protein
MKGLPKVGTLGEERFVVEPRHAIDFAEGAMPAVLSTPWLIWFLEHAARAAILPLLEPGESTVGDGGPGPPPGSDAGGTGSHLHGSRRLRRRRRGLVPTRCV